MKLFLFNATDYVVAENLVKANQLWLDLQNKGSAESDKIDGPALVKEVTDKVIIK
jgi:hypothetical protein